MSLPPTLSLIPVFDALEWYALQHLPQCRLAWWHCICCSTFLPSNLNYRWSFPSHSLPHVSLTFHLVNPPKTSLTIGSWGEHHFYPITTDIQRIIVLLNGLLNTKVTLTKWTYNVINYNGKFWFNPTGDVSNTLCITNSTHSKLCTALKQK